jgi:membrane protease YdiL (CAAX protease family)
VRKVSLSIAGAGYLILLLAFWLVARHSPLALSLAAAFPPAFASVGLLLAPLWFFGFGAAAPLRSCRHAMKIAAATSLALPYFIWAMGGAGFYWRAAVIVMAFPPLLAAFLRPSQGSPRMTWRDCLALAILATTYFSGWLRAAWPSPALAPLPKLFLADVALYCFLVVRDLPGAGYSLVPHRSAWVVGGREWLLYLPFALLSGELVGFIRFHPGLPSAGALASSALVTFFLIALPEELFFRSLLQNLLETRLGRTRALVVAAVLFGLSHFTHHSPFHWGYVLLASMAGIFYGRAWRAQRQVLAAVVTHTAVDVVWSLWFR